MAMDPYAVPPGAAPLWEGAWPPDPSWDQPVLPPPPETPIPDVAFAPSVLPGEMAPPPAPAPWDADLIQLEPVTPAAPIAPTELAAPAPASPWDADLIEMEPADEQPADLGLTDQERAGRLMELAQADPVRYAMAQADLDLAREEQFAAKQLKAAKAERLQAEEAEAVYRNGMAKARQASEQVAAEADRLAQEKVDPEGWFDSRSTFGKIATFVSAIVGGLVQSRQGGANQGMAMINDAIERHIEAQRANIAHRREMNARKGAAIATSIEQLEADRRTEDAFRQAALQRALQGIEAEKAQYNPAGTRARRLADVGMGVQGQLAAAQEQSHRANQKWAMDVAKFELEQAKFAEDVRKNKAAERARGGRGGAASKMKWSPEQLAMLYPGNPVPPIGAPPMTPGEYSQWLEGKKKGRDLLEPTEGQKLDIQLEKEARGTTLHDPSAKGTGKGTVDRTFRDFNGEASKIEPEMAKALRPQLGDMSTLAKLVAQQKELIDKNGGVLNPRSDEAKLVKSNAATIANLLRGAYKMGTLDAAAMDLAKDIQGGDPTAFVGDAGVALEQMIVQGELKLDSDLKAAGWNPAEGVAYRLPRYEAPVAKPDPDYDRAIGSSGSADLDSFADVFTAKGKASLDASLGRALTDEQAKGIASLAERAKTETGARAKLEAAAKEADNPAARKAAAAALKVLDAD